MGGLGPCECWGHVVGGIEGPCRGSCWRGHVVEDLNDRWIDRCLFSIFT